MKPILTLLLLALTLGAPGHAAAPPETLDTLLAQRMEPDNPTVAMLPEARALHLGARVAGLPKPGKTAYMNDALAMKSMRRPSAVTHKMWLRSPGGKQVMAYVEDTIASAMLRTLKPDAAVEVDVLWLWNSRHGPGLLVTAYAPVAADIKPVPKPTR
jgi:hypothetical protein